MSSPHAPDGSGGIDADEVWAKLDTDRESGALARRIQGDADVVYGASSKIKGGIVACYRDGQRVEGYFRDGVFIASSSEEASVGKGS